MDTAALKYFLVTAETQHMTKAAQILNITQPTLSTSIRRLERELGYELFDRTGRNIQLNEYGSIFYRGCSAAAALINDSLAQMEAHKQSLSNFVRLDCSSSIANTKLIDHLLEDGVNLQVSFVPQDWESALLGRSCDLVITAGITNQASISRVTLIQQELVIVCGLDHPLAKAKSIDPELLGTYPFCSTGAPHALLNVAKDKLTAMNIHPRVTFLGRTSGDMLNAVRSGKYLSLMVRRNLPKTDDLVILPIIGFSLELPLNLYWRKSDDRNHLISSTCRKIIVFYNS